MNILTISICFKYRGQDNEFNSSMIDLYNIDKIFNKISNTRIIYSDIKDISESSYNYPDLSISDFLCKYLSCCRGKSNEILVNIINTKTDILTAFNNVVNFSEYDKVVIYLNGHGNKGLLLPSDEILYLDEIFSIIKGYNNEFVIITDCCDFSCNLSFQFINDRFYMRDQDIESMRVFLMSSCIEGETTLSTSRGSPFTKFLVAFLQGGSINLVKLVEYIEDNGYRINIHATRPYKHIPSWLPSSNMNIDFHEDYIEIECRSE